MQLPDFSPLRILVVGDVMIDRYLTGRVDRISPEAPVPIVRLGEEDNRPGGAANVALNLAALGVGVGLAGAVGDDANAELFRNLLDANRIGGDLLVADAGRCTTVKTRLIAQSQQLLRVDREDTRDLDDPIANRLLAGLEMALAAGADLVLLQDYNKGVLTPAVIDGVLALAERYGVPTAVDPKHANFWRYRGVTLFKPNLREMQQQLDFPLRPDRAALDRAAAVVFDRLHCASIMITLSEHGIYVHDGTVSAIFPTVARSVADVSGAGDTVISVAAAGLAAGMGLTEVARLANLAGAQVIARVGVVPVDREQLAAEFARG